SVVVLVAGATVVLALIVVGFVRTNGVRGAAHHRALVGVVILAVVVVVLVTRVALAVVVGVDLARVRDGDTVVLSVLDAVVVVVLVARVALAVVVGVDLTRVRDRDTVVGVVGDAVVVGVGRRRGSRRSVYDRRGGADSHPERDDSRPHRGDQK